MISTIADLLEVFRHKESELLDKQDISHAPTIGRMYEGLTREILERIIPADLDLRVVSGFITNDKGDLSKQIDCMLVIGEGHQIPYTDDYKYHINNVLATIEVKKNLYTDDLDSAYQNLVSVRALCEGNLPENRLFNGAHRLILQSDPDTYEDRRQLPIWKRQVGSALYIESITPVRIVLGYHGFASELGFRKAFISYLDNKLQTPGYGAAYLPSLIICGEYSLVKLNGMPYAFPITPSREELYAKFGIVNLSDKPPIAGDLWVLYASYASNPMVLLLELLWTRLTYKKKLPLSVFGLDLQLENLRPLLLAKAIEHNQQVGWYYEQFDLSQQILDRIPAITNWKPVELNFGQFIVLKYVILAENAGKDSIDADTRGMLEELHEHGYSPAESINYLKQSGLISIENNRLRSLTRECSIAALPDGRIVAGEDNSSRFTNWLMNYSSI
jgi:hypothetical protein